MKIKALFLDLDGVLNSTASMMRFSENHGRTITTTRIDEHFDPEAIDRLNIITNLTGAKIVVSSTWRIGYEHNFQGLQALLQSNGVQGEVIGATTTKGYNRGNQIQEWLDDHKDQVEAFVILDDDHLTPDSSHSLESSLIKTTFAKGLEDEHMWRAIEMLGRKDQ